jgi:hypothetical protein
MLMRLACRAGHNTFFVSLWCKVFICFSVIADLLAQFLSFLLFNLAATTGTSCAMCRMLVSG